MSGLRKAVLSNRLKAGALIALAGFLLVSVLIMSLEAVGHFSPAFRWVLFVVWWISALAAVGMGLLWPILKYSIFGPTDEQLADEYAKRMPEVHDRVLNALQLLQRVENANKEGYSPDLIIEAGRSVAEDLRPINPDSLTDKKSLVMGRKAALIAAVVTVLLLIFAGSSMLSAADRVMNPSQEFLPPAKFSLELKPGNAKLIRGDSLVVDVLASGEVPASITLERIEKGKSATEPVTLKGENGKFRYVYRGITTCFEYWAREATAKTETYKVEVEELPAVRYLSLRLTPPAYTGQDEQALEENVGDITALAGTKVKLSLASTKSLKQAHLEFFQLASDGKSDTLVTQSPLNTDGTKANTDFTVAKSSYYRIRLTDTEGRENRDLIRYRIIARTDEAPMITLVEPAHDVEIAGNSKVAVVSEAMDDFGFSAMNLRYHRGSGFDNPAAEIKEEDYQKIPVSFKTTAPGKALSEYIWDMASLDLLPEDQISFFVEVYDNDRITGPKRAKSEIRVLRFPSMAEIFQDQEKQEESRQISLNDLMKESQELREKVDEAVEEFKSNPEMSWERKKEIEQLMEKQKAMNEILNQVADQMEKAQDQMQMRSMFSPEVMDKMKKVQELVKEVMTPEMQKALQQMQQAMQQPNEEQMRKAMENFKMTQEMFEKALDQAMNVLNQMKMAKKLDELSRRLDELSKQQEQLDNKMNEQQNSPKDSKKNSDQQKKMSDEMKQIEKEMQKLAEDMKKQNTPGQEKMQELQKQSEQEKLSEEMKKNSEQMQMSQNSSCKKKGQKMRRKMSEMSNEMQNIKQQMTQNQDQEALEKLEKSRDKLLDLSMRQEQLWKDSKNVDASSPQLSEYAEEQENIKQALQRVNQDLQQLAKESMYVTPKLLAAMTAAKVQMDQAGKATQDRDPRTASHYRQQALGAVNSALKENSSSCSNCKNSCNKPNPNSMCNKAGQMAGQQQKLGEQTMQQMMGGGQNQGSLSMGEQAACQRLADEQRELAKSAKELAEEAAASQQSVGKLDDLADKMEDVAKDLENRNITDRTLQKQQEIENKLLDFQRANREREFSPKRNSNTGIDVVRTSPKALPAKPGKDQLHEDLLRALDAKYSPDYEDLIRKYFDALSKVK